MPSPNKKILIVDDDPDICEYLAAFLTDNGYEATTAKDGVEALEKVEAEKPDLVALDITMPEKSGVRFYRDMKEDPKRKAVPIIIVSGVSEDFEKFISTRRQVPPPEGYIHKPVDLDRLLALVKQHIG
ncbi:MAG: response regulator [Candidatus Sumerlaeota bacterium]|nr:response regulator [Candidatus Sumerlaeota bacterium]